MLWECLLKLYESSLKCKSQWRSCPKKSNKKNTFFELQNAFFFHSFFFILTPPTSSVHNFLIYFILFGFKLSNLNSFEIVILSSTSHRLPLTNHSNRVIFKDFWRGLEIGYELFSSEFFVKTILNFGGP